MSQEIYNKDGLRVREMFSTGTPLEVYTWDSGAVQIWPTGQPEQAASEAFNNPAWYSNAWTLNPSNASLAFETAHGIERVYARGGDDNTKMQIDWQAGQLTKGNTVWENAGLGSDIPFNNLASLTWPSFTNFGDTVPAREDTINFKYYFYELDSNEQWYDYNIFGPVGNLDGFDGTEIGSGALDWGPPTATWYGERLLLSEVTETIDRVSASYVENNGSSSWNLPANTDAGEYIRIYATGRILVWRTESAYSESAQDFLARKGRLLITVERNDYDPGNEYIITWVNTYTEGVGNYYWMYSGGTGAVNYSDTPGDQSSTTIVTGENVTYRIYEDIT